MSDNPTDAARAYHDEPIPPLRHDPTMFRAGPVLHGPHGPVRTYVVRSIADVTAPTAAELAAGVEITAAIEPLPRKGTCGVCGRRDVPVTMLPGNDKPVCVDEVACYVEFRRGQGWDAVARLVSPDDEVVEP